MPSARAALGALLASALATAALLASGPARAAAAEVAARPPPKRVLGGFDLALTLWGVSGLTSAPEAYESQLLIYLEPRLNVGERWFRGRWLEMFSVGARLYVETELAGNDARFRTSGFASPALLRDLPEGVPLGEAQVPFGLVEGTGRRALLSDLWLSALHERVAVIPKIGVVVELGLRLVIPTSDESRRATLQAAPSLYAGLSRAFWRFHLGWGFRAVKYFHEKSVVPLAHLDAPVVVNGATVQPYQPESTGVLNPSYGFVNAFSLTLDLPKGFGLEADYLIMNTFTYGFSRCDVPGVPTADVCRDGAALGEVRRPAERDSHWFLFSVSWRAADWLSLGVGISTYQPIRRPNGDVSNPIFNVNRDNNTTAFLSLSTSAEAVASAIRGRRGGAGQAPGTAAVPRTR